MPKRGIALGIHAAEGWVAAILMVEPPIIHRMKDPTKVRPGIDQQHTTPATEHDIGRWWV